MENNLISYTLYLYKIKVGDMGSSCSMHKAEKKLDNTEFYSQSEGKKEITL
jgi:hypothetical protein